MEKFIAKIRDVRSRETPCPLPNIQLICHTILRRRSETSAVMFGSTSTLETNISGEISSLALDSTQ